MIRLLIWLIVLAPFVGAGLWLAEHPGTLAIDMLGYRIELSVMAALVIISAGLLLLLMLALAIHGLIGLPSHLSAKRRLHHTQNALDAITHAMSALAIADYTSAERHILATSTLLGTTHPSALLLTTQLAHAQGNTHKVHSQLEQMLLSDQTRAVGLRGMIEQAIHDGALDNAMTYATEAYQARPHDRWLTLIMLDLHTRQKEWQSARKILATARKKRALTSNEQARYEAMVALAMASDPSVSADQSYDAASLAMQRAPEFSPARIIGIRLLAAQNHVRAMVSTLIKLWPHHPHLPSMMLLFEAMQQESPKKQRKRLDRVISTRPDCLESHLALAQWYMRSNQWAEARHSLRSALAFRESPQIYHLFAEIERQESGDEKQANEWLRRALLCTPDPAWVCHSCHHSSEEWHLHCPHCQCFDSLSWQQPASDSGAVLAV